jgi:uncharacterized protein involved in exopolysaccharide biosynthesis
MSDFENNAESGTNPADAWWMVVGDVYRGRRVIVVITMFAAIASIVISLLLPKSYYAAARVIPPEANSSLSSGLLGSLPSSARLLFGGGTGDYSRYLAILTSRSVLGAAVDRFDLVNVYELASAADARDRAIAMLQDQSVLYVDGAYEFLEIGVNDRDPQRAAEIANFFVARLNEVNSTLTSQSASLFRRYVEKRYVEAFSVRDSVLRNIQAFQSQYGLINLPAQTEAFFAQIAETRVAMIQTEVQYESLLAQYGESNAQVRAAGTVVSASRRRYREALEGKEAVLPVAQDTIPAVARQYANLELERIIQDTIIETVAPVLEQAKFEEQRESVAVQVIDNAEVPVKKASPKRAAIVILSVISATLLALLYVLASAFWRRKSPVVAARLAAMK